MDVTTAHSYCDKHLAEREAWLDYRMPPAQINLISIGNTVAEVNRRRAARFEDWRNTITSQQALIEAACRAGRGCCSTDANTAFEARPVPTPTRGSGPVTCTDDRCRGHRENCLFGRPHGWSTWYENGQLVRTTDTLHCVDCGGVCIGDEPTKESRS